MTNAKTPEEEKAAKELRARQWQIVAELRRQGDPTSHHIVELMEKILRETEGLGALQQSQR